MVDHTTLVAQNPLPLAQQAISTGSAYDEMSLSAMEMNDIELDTTDSPEPLYQPTPPSILITQICETSSSLPPLPPECQRVWFRAELAQLSC